MNERPRKNGYRLNIKALDSGIPQKTNTHMLQINVADIQTGPPKFTNAVYHAELLENSKGGTHVTSVKAVKQGSSNYHATFHHR